MSEALEVEEIAPHQTLQYASRAHQADTAIAGMWLFLASEVLFFGALFLAFGWVRHSHPEGFALATRHTNLWLGGINTALLVSSSFVFSCGLLAHERGRTRALVAACLITMALGTAFIGLKAVEWGEDFSAHLFPSQDFALEGADAQGARLFYCLYFVATGLHAIHMLVGICLVGWLALRAHRGALCHDGGPWTTPVEVTGLYWSFVDMVWMVLFPLIYVLGRAT